MVLVPGTSIDIPVGTAFQYQNVSDAYLKFICVSMPQWPGDSEATYVQGVWQTTVDNSLVFPGNNQQSQPSK